MDVRVIADNSLCPCLETRGLTSLGRGNDHGPLTFSERTEEIDDPVRLIGAASKRPAAFQGERFVGVLCPHLGEERTVREFLGGNSIDRVQMPERRALPIIGSFPDLPKQFVSGAKVELLNNPGTNVNVVFPGGIGFFLTPDKPRTTRKNLQDAEGRFVCHALITVSKWGKGIWSLSPALGLLPNSMAGSWSVSGKIAGRTREWFAHHRGPPCSGTPLATFDPGNSPGPGNLGQKRHFVHPYVLSAPTAEAPGAASPVPIPPTKGVWRNGFEDDCSMKVSPPGDTKSPPDRSKTLRSP